MSKPTKTVLVLVKADYTYDRSVLDFAKNYCTRNHYKLSIVHSTTPLKRTPWISELPSEYLFADHEFSASKKQATRVLKSYAEQMSPDIEADFHIYDLDEKEIIYKFQEDSDLESIIMGSLGKERRFLENGINRSIGIIREFEIKFIIVNIHQQLLDVQPQRVIVPDDLQAEHLSAIKTAYEYTNSLGKCSVLHLHIKGGMIHWLKKMKNLLTHKLESIKMLDAAIVSDSPLNETLRSRWEVLGPNPDNVDYTSSVVEADTVSMLDLLSEWVGYSVVVFGRHHSFYPETAYFGKVSYDNMLRMATVCIIVP